MKTIVGYPGNGIFAQQVARAFEERDELLSFFTTFAYLHDGALAHFLEKVS